MALDDVATWTKQALPELTDDLRMLVELETPSNDKALLDRGLDALSRWLVDRLGEPDESVRHDGGEHGDALEATYTGTKPGTVLVLCHYDTVWPAGTLAEWPFEVRDGRASGPGVFDMKHGIVQAVWALRCLRELDLPRPTVRFLFNGDEEIGSPSARPHIERLSEDALATLVLEASVDGALKTARKGVGLFDVTVEGIESHAGLDPEAGVSAIHQLAELIPRIVAAAAPEKGTTINVGLVEGGSGRNVVARHATCGIDIRVSDPAEQTRLDEMFAALRPSDFRARLIVEGQWNRPPMVEHEESRKLFAVARGVADELGWAKLDGVAVGGASDGNFVSGLGRPVLDGLGAVGAGAHARHEHVLLDHMPARTALVAGILTALADRS
ncbi:M20 family metallopeptidase [Saccharomonospora glauca]|uniref:Acetylornithine deacetylase/succinyldiaminopimelate desuccinylase-like deacylase n=1 Tax=Saccharomonospora glauca K62 TaxID=928724 RepID=I1D0M1_9PSEU|nr:M20 family metallopeptidase [Saccharomonospora glauca]EIE98495.1 acetylornithine deacetylase/succinyldiaminopimelate desuccinylase-like deacylase [Saccharomonospora glauca K62]